MILDEDIQGNRSGRNCCRETGYHKLACLSMCCTVSQKIRESIDSTSPSHLSEIPKVKSRGSFCAENSRDFNIIVLLQN